MSPVDLVVRSARLRWAGEWVEAGLAVEGGHIARIAKDPHLPTADRTIDASGLLLLPGAVDTHTHFTYGRPDRTDIGTGSRACASGGVTTFVEQAASTPQHCPPTLTLLALEAKVALGRATSVVDFGVHGGGCAGNLGEVPALVRAGVAGVKVYMGWSPVGDYTACDDATILAVAERLRGTGAPLEVHAENASIVAEATSRLQRAGRTRPEVYTDSRPTLAEDEAVASVARIGRAADAAVHIVHLSSGFTLPTVREARAAGTDLSVETCPHYLFFDTSAYRERGPYAKVNPPLRSRAEVEAMRAGVRDGTVDFLASDHAAPSSEKAPGAEDIFSIPPGFPGSETMYPVMLKEAFAGGLDWDRLLYLLAEGPARRFGYYPRKGVLLPGADADFVLVDPKATTTIRNDRLHHHSEFTMFEGWRLTGVPVRTVSRGVTVAEGTFPGTVHDLGGRGDFVPARNVGARPSGGAP
ncbi:MAG: dihydroorotase [Thermoplasmata archaeon]